MATSSKRTGKSTMPKTTKTTVPAPSAEPMTDIDSSKAPKGVVVEPSVVETLSPVVVSNELRKKELFELVVERSGMKKKDVKPVVEAMLAVLGDAWAEQREMNLPPLGKIKVQRGKELSDGRVVVLKLRQKSARLNAASETTETSDTTTAAE
ncbi:MAG: HU family DNA-binding protein [Sulfitobacter sp.]